MPRAIALAVLASWALACAAGVLQIGGRWLDDDGRAVSLADWRGRYSVLTMSVGGCRKICTTTLRRMEELQAIADQRGLQLDFLVVSIDPKSDTPQAWREYRGLRGLNRANWHFLGGSEDDTRRLANALGISYWFYDEHPLHDFKIALVGPDGEIRRTLVWADDRPASLFAGIDAGPAVKSDRVPGQRERKHP